MSFSRNPALNLKAVLQETGIAADTLRAWERRYGLPLPERTAGGHRLYSQYDLETIKWLIARQAEGLSISRAVDLWNEKQAAGNDPLADLPSSNLTLDRTFLPAILTPNTTLDALRTEWITACLGFNETTAEQVLNQALSMFPVESVCVEVLQKGMSGIGTLWYKNDASVQQEHFASGLAMRRLDALLSACPSPSRPQTILIGCPPEEWHTFTALMLALLLRRRGLNIIYLGANVPSERFAETIATVKADLIVLIAQTLISAATLKNTALALSSQKVPLSFGGRIFKEGGSLLEYVPGYYLGDTMETCLDHIEKILKNKVEPAETKTAAQEYVKALHAFNTQRLHIEGTVRESLQSTTPLPEEMNNGIQMLGDNIIAALEFGSMQHVTFEMEWLKELLQARQRSPHEVVHFMQAYLHAVRKHIHGDAAPIEAWLSSAQANA